jgi:hypothetical protein
MMLYRAIILLLTGGMIVLHLLEWHAAKSRAAEKLRLALCLESVYYLAAFPALYAVSHSWSACLIIFFAMFHWGGLALLEVRGFWRRQPAPVPSAAAGRMVVWAIAAFDLAEVMLLAYLGSVLYALTFERLP